VVISRQLVVNPWSIGRAVAGPTEPTLTGSAASTHQETQASDGVHGRAGDKSWVAPSTFCMASSADDCRERAFCLQNIDVLGSVASASALANRIAFRGFYERNTNENRLGPALSCH
jgi:hypothetical protein